MSAAKVARMAILAFRWTERDVTPMAEGIPISCDRSPQPPPQWVLPCHRREELGTGHDFDRFTRLYRNSSCFSCREKADHPMVRCAFCMLIIATISPSMSFSEVIDFLSCFGLRKINQMSLGFHGSSPFLKSDVSVHDGVKSKGNKDSSGYIPEYSVMPC